MADDPRPTAPTHPFATVIGWWHRLTTSIAARRSLAAVLTIGAIWYAATITADGHLQDFDAYYRGGWGFLHGGDPYDPTNPGSILPFVYPPFAAIVVAPFALLGQRAGAFAISCLSLVAAYWTIRLVVADLAEPCAHDEPPTDREVTPWWTAVALLIAMCSEPFWATVGLGQINLLLAVLVVVDLLRLRDTRWAGTLIGLAIGIKLTPVVFVVYLLATRRFRAAIVAGATAAATVAVGALSMAGATWDYFVDRSVVSEWWDSVILVGKPGNQSLDGLLTRWTGSEQSAHVPWLIAGALLLATGTWTAVHARHHLGEVAGMSVVATTGLVIAPTSWTHYWIWWIVVACLLVSVATRLQGLRRAVAVGAAVAWSVPFLVGRSWFPPYPEDIPTDRSFPTVLFDNMYVVVGVAAIVLGLGLGLAVGRRRYSDAS